jgi:flagellar biosynthesis protein FlhF
MKVKSYYSESVEAAIARASQELGPDAMLLSSRRTPPESKHLGEYEVVLALPAPESNGFDEELSRVLKSGPPPQNVDRLTREIADLRRQIERTASMFQKSGSLAGAPVTQSAALLRLFSTLIANEVEPELAHDLINACTSCGDNEPEASLEAEISRLIAVDSRLGTEGSAPAVTAFVGPPGAGKTSVLVKLAVQRGIARGKRVHLISLDGERIGGADQLRTFAALLGVGVDVLDEPAGLGTVLAKCGNRDLVLIDTPGLSRERAEEAQELAGALTAQNAIDVQLVLPISMKAADLRRTSAAWQIFRSRRLIFTRLDETETYGAILNEIVRTGCPVSFLSGGQLIPDDVQAADASGVTELVTGRRTANASAAVAACGLNDGFERAYTAQPVRSSGSRR